MRHTERSGEFTDQGPQKNIAIQLHIGLSERNSEPGLDNFGSSRKAFPLGRDERAETPTVFLISIPGQVMQSIFSEALLSAGQAHKVGLFPACTRDQFPRLLRNCILQVRYQSN